MSFFMGSSSAQAAGYSRLAGPRQGPWNRAVKLASLSLQTVAETRSVIVSQEDLPPGLLRLLLLYPDSPDLQPTRDHGIAAKLHAEELAFADLLGVALGLGPTAGGQAGTEQQAQQQPPVHRRPPARVSLSWSPARPGSRNI